MLEIELLKECPNYDEIINYHYKKDDYITENIINTYQNEIFNKKSNIMKIKLLDKIVLMYLNDYDFNNHVRSYYLDETLNYFEQDDLKLIELYDKYRLNNSKAVNNNRWI